MADDAASSVLSIQGEQQQQETGYVRASEEDVDLYVDRVSDEVLACRERGRHLFPTIRQAGIHFTDVDRDGLFIRRLTCTCCELAVKVEKWEGVRQRGRTRFSRVASNLEYRTGSDGQVYLAPSGRGHMTPRQIGDSVASKALAGQSITALRKAATKAAAENKAAAEAAAKTPAASRKAPAAAATTSTETSAAQKPAAQKSDAQKSDAQESDAATRTARKPAARKPAARKPAARRSAAGRSTGGRVRKES